MMMVNKQSMFAKKRNLQLYNKKAISGVVVVVMMVLITITLIAVISTFTIKFVKDNLKDESCIKLINTLTLVQDGTCYNSAGDETSVRVRVGDTELEEIYISIGNVDDVNTYRLKEGEDGDGSILNYPAGTPIKLPSSGGGERTYKFRGQFSEVKVGNVVADEVCPSEEKMIIKRCR